MPNFLLEGFMDDMLFYRSKKGRETFCKNRFFMNLYKFFLEKVGFCDLKKPVPRAHRENHIDVLGCLGVVGKGHTCGPTPTWQSKLSSKVAMLVCHVGSMQSQASGIKENTHNETISKSPSRWVFQKRRKHCSSVKSQKRNSSFPALELLARAPCP